MFACGDLIVACVPFAFTLFNEQRHKRCDFCFKLLNEVKICCPTCRYVNYCSTQCQRNSETIHRLECPVLVTRPLRTLTRLIARMIVRRKLDPNYSEEVGNYRRSFDDLMDHFENVVRDADSMYAFDDIYKELELIFQNEFEVNELIKIYGKVLVNSFAVQNELLQPIGRAVYLGASIFDHSCVPEASFMFVGTSIFVKAITEIKSDDCREIKICYINELDTRKERMNYLQANYYFKCDCERCTKEDDFECESQKLQTINDRFERLCFDPISFMETRNELCNKKGAAKRSATKFDLKSFANCCCIDREQRQLATNLIAEIEREKSNLISLHHVLCVRICDLLSSIEADLELSLKVIEVFRRHYGPRHPRLALKLYLTAVYCDFGKHLTLKQKLLIEARNIAAIILPSVREHRSMKLSQRNEPRRSRYASAVTRNSINDDNFPTLLTLIEKEFNLIRHGLRVRPSVSIDRSTGQMYTPAIKDWSRDVDSYFPSKSRRNPLGQLRTRNVSVERSRNLCYSNYMPNVYTSNNSIGNISRDFGYSRSRDTSVDRMWNFSTTDCCLSKPLFSESALSRINSGQTRSRDVSLDRAFNAYSANSYLSYPLMLGTAIAKVGHEFGTKNFSYYGYNGLCRFYA